MAEMKPLVIYHDSCADGFAAAFCAWLSLGDDAEYFPCKYAPADKWPDVGAYAGRNVYILDFSFPRETMNHIFATAKRVVWLDHHKTAFEMWCGEYSKGMIHEDEQYDRTIVLDDNQSGARIAWDYFHGATLNEVPAFIDHIDDYDRWQFKLPGTKEFNKALWSHTPWSFTQWRDWFYDVEAGFNHKYWADFYTEGAAILRAHDQNVKSVAWGGARECVIQGAQKLVNLGSGPDLTTYAKGLIVNCPPHLTSDVGHELATKSGTFGLCWCLSKDGDKAKCSLRSNGDYDVSAIAKVFGGGGHKNAAGFEVPITTLLGWMK